MSARQNDPQWREFEKLVSRIEKIARSASVKSPDFIVDLRTGEYREVDASIRMHDGTKEIVISIECRDRKAPQDVQWIDCLDGKRRAIGVDRTIAVSSSSFSESAIKAARHCGIELRVLNDLTDEDIRSMLGIPDTSLTYISQQMDMIVGPRIEYDQDDAIELPQGFAPPAAPTDRDRLFYHPSCPLLLTMDDLWQVVLESQSPFGSIPVDGTKVRKVIDLVSGEPIRMMTPHGFCRVNRLLIEVDLYWGVQEFEGRQLAYRNATDEKQPLTVQTEYEGKDGAKHVRFSIQQQSDSLEASISVQLRGDT